MKQNINFVVFDSLDKVNDEESEKIIKMCDGLDEEYKNLIIELLTSKYLTANTGNFGKLDISLFLETDKTVNLDKLELALILSSKFLEHVSKSEDIHISLSGIQTYAKLRGIEDDKQQLSQETQFIGRFSTAVLEAEFPKATLFLENNSYL